MAQRVPSRWVRNETISHDDNSGSATRGLGGSEQENRPRRSRRALAKTSHGNANGLAPKGSPERELHQDCY